MTADEEHEERVRWFLRRVSLDEPDRFRVVCAAYEVLTADQMRHRERREHGWSLDIDPEVSADEGAGGVVRSDVNANGQWFRGTFPGQRSQGVTDPLADQTADSTLSADQGVTRAGPRRW